ncbi:MAG TPA: DUF1059 domain-containing protein [Vulgatibacter sp.]|nr:DUF1059 domain-containing protein [Vulgatibacter sp.]
MAEVIAMARMMMDCREFPSESKCTLVMSGEEDELLRAATQHAITVHGHRDSPELRRQLRSVFKRETPEAHSSHP